MIRFKHVTHPLQEIEKKREEKRIEMELFREWNQPRDDLDCDDLKVC